MDKFSEIPENKSSQSKKYFLTENNPTLECIERYKRVDCQWMAICKEHQDNDIQTPHIHIAIVFKGKRRWSTIKKLFPRADVRIMRGSPQDCVTYMTKENPQLDFEKGEMPKSASQSREDQKKKWDDAYKAAKEGRFDDIPKDMWVRYQNSFKQIYYDNQKDKSMDDFGDKELKDHFLWIWGPTGTGKSHTAHRIAKEIDPENEPYLKDLNKWWNGYAHQRVTIIEEADPKRCEHLASYFKKWADKWSFTAECKGTVIPACRPEYIIVTSNYDIDTCFPEEMDRDPIHRRMTEVNLTNRDYEIQWPKEIQKEGRAFAVPGNINPEQQENSPPPDSIPGSQPQEDFEVEDLPSEPDEPMKKKRKCIED